MADEGKEIRSLLGRWARAVHADDIVMFDVPPPHRGVRGLAEYHEHHSFARA
jgi:hypothetical protein